MLRFLVGHSQRLPPGPWQEGRPRRGRGEVWAGKDGCPGQGWAVPLGSAEAGGRPRPKGSGRWGPNRRGSRGHASDLNRILRAGWAGVGCSFSRGSAQEGGELRAWTRVRHVEDLSSWEEASWDLERLGRSEEGVPRQPLRLQAQCPRGVPGSRSKRRCPAEMLRTLCCRPFGSRASQHLGLMGRLPGPG